VRSHRPAGACGDGLTQIGALADTPDQVVDALTRERPTRHEHINFYGQYHFNIEEAQQRQGLRSLRQPGVLSSLA
jgi:hypothetical protein